MRRPLTPRTSRLAGLLILLLAVAGGGLAEQSVLCVGADGHVDVEGLLDGCCAPQGSAVTADVVVAAADPGGCGTCSDFVLEGRTTTGPSRDGVPAPVIASTVIPQRGTADRRASRPADSRRGGLRGVTTLAPLLAIRLLV